jgi:hypothetical protein
MNISNISAFWSVNGQLNILYGVKETWFLGWPFLAKGSHYLSPVKVPGGFSVWSMFILEYVYDHSAYSCYSLVPGMFGKEFLFEGEFFGVWTSSLDILCHFVGGESCDLKIMGGLSDTDEPEMVT